MAKISKGLVAASALIALSASPAYAYLDAGTGSMIIQVFAAGIAGVMVVGRLYWHKLLVLLRFRKETPTNANPNDNNKAS